MPSHSKSLSSLLFLSLLVSACGGDDNAGAQPTLNADAGPVVTASNDAGAPAVQDAGFDAGPTCQLGASCTLPGGALGYQNCFPTPSCVDRATVDNFLDGGLQTLLDSSIVGQLLGDAGIGINEAGFTFGDATIQIEAGALKCPTGFMCSSIGAAAGLPISACADPSAALFGVTLPPTCTAAGPCMVGGMAGTCQNILIDMYCVVPCN